jgi:hypothetical protein
MISYLTKSIKKMSCSKDSGGASWIKCRNKMFEIDLIKIFEIKKHLPAPNVVPDFYISSKMR